MTTPPPDQLPLRDEAASRTTEPGTDNAEFIAALRFTADGLIPAVIQEHATGEVLMVGWMNAESLRRTFTEARTVFWSRSRQELWRKGDTSGNSQHVVSVASDCDRDVLLIQVRSDGPACHTGARTCFAAGDEVVL